MTCQTPLAGRIRQNLQVKKLQVNAHNRGTKIGALACWIEMIFE